MIPQESIKPQDDFFDQPPQHPTLNHISDPIEAQTTLFMPEEEDDMECPVSVGPVSTFFG